MNSPVTADWLALRRPADTKARDASAGNLAEDLDGFLRGRCGHRAARLIDVGAGTGSGAAWLRPRLGLPQQWLLLDRDPALLAAAPPVADGWAEPMVADLADLRKVLATRPADALTCQALLDLLTADEIRDVAGAAADLGAAVLASLSVTGETVIRPAHRTDGLVASAFNAHQQRFGRPGPDAGRLLDSLLTELGYRVTAATTTWRLGSGAAELTRQWLEGRASAAVEQSPADAAVIGDWLAARLADLRAGRLRAEVGHVDILGLPG